MPSGGHVTHGDAPRGNQSPEYAAWCEMKKRCYNKRCSNYYNYGARGIFVCKRWRNSFANFLADMGRKPSPAHSLGRIKNGRGYSRSNCEWQDRTTQNENRRNAVLVILNGKKMNVSKAAALMGVPRPTLYSHVHRRGSKNMVITMGERLIGEPL